MKEAKFLVKLSKKQTRARKSKCTGSMPDVTADNLTLDEATDGLPADSAANTTEESICNNKGSSKQKSTGTAPFNMKRSKHAADNEIDVKGAVYVLECMLMMLKPGGSG